MIGLSCTAVGMRPIETCVDIYNKLQPELNLEYLELAIGTRITTNIKFDMPLVLHDRTLYIENRRLNYLEYLDDVYVGKVQENSVETTSNELFRIFPNPTNGTVFIETNELVESIEVLNALGQKISFKKIDAMSSISIELPYEVGVYYLRLNCSDKTETIRVIKTNQ